MIFILKGSMEATGGNGRDSPRPDGIGRFCPARSSTMTCSPSIDTVTTDRGARPRRRPRSPFPGSLRRWVVSKPGRPRSGAGRWRPAENYGALGRTVAHDRVPWCLGRGRRGTVPSRGDHPDQALCQETKRLPLAGRPVVSLPRRTTRVCDGSRVGPGRLPPPESRGGLRRLHEPDTVPGRPGKRDRDARSGCREDRPPVAPRPVRRPDRYPARPRTIARRQRRSVHHDRSRGSLQLGLLEPNADRRGVKSPE